jgi:hydroxymethylglutaryl-CoA lyase
LRQGASVRDGRRCGPVITDVTLREFGQNVPSSSLRFFSPQFRINLALKLIDLGFRNLEVLSCVHPRIAPAMAEETICMIARGIGRVDHVNVITLVPNRAGYKTFLSAGLGPDEYHHSLGIFFSAVEAHNRLNLGRTIEDTLEDYKVIVRDAFTRKIRIAAYVSAAFGYRSGPQAEIIRPSVRALGAYIERLLDMGAATVTLSDLQGVAGENETRSVLERLLKGRSKEIVDRLGYHPHHVHGEKAVANSWAAYEVGLRRFDASLGGTGGCVTGAPGNQPTEALTAFFEDRGIPTGLDLKGIQRLVSFVQEALYRKINFKPFSDGQVPPTNGRFL